MNNYRNESLDLLRIIAILMVISVHYLSFGGIETAKNINFTNTVLAGGIAVATHVCVNLFYLISGFFINENETNFDRCKKRILKIWIPTFTYSMIIPLVLFCFGKIQLSIKDLISIFFPILSGQYWFSTCFIAIILLTPFIATFIKKLEINKLIILSAIMVFIDGIQPVTQYLLNGETSESGYGIMHAITMCIIGFTLKSLDKKIKQFVSITIYMACIAIISLLVFFTGNFIFVQYNSFFIIIESIALFMFIKNIKIKKLKFSKVSPYIFGIYLLNSNNYAINFIWQDIFKCYKFYDSNLMVVHMAGSVALFALAAFIIEYFRTYLFKLACNIFKNKKI